MVNGLFGDRFPEEFGKTLLTQARNSTIFYQGCMCDTIKCKMKVALCNLESIMRCVRRSLHGHRAIYSLASMDTYWFRLWKPRWLIQLNVPCLAVDCQQGRQRVHCCKHKEVDATCSARLHSASTHTCIAGHSTTMNEHRWEWHCDKKLQAISWCRDGLQEKVQTLL